MDREKIWGFLRENEIKIGHSQNKEAFTGTTVILAEKGVVAGVDVRGFAPGTRETDVLSPIGLVQEVHALVLSGGSAFGLDAAGGVMQYLDEKGVGFEVGNIKIPIVPAAIIFDLFFHRVNFRDYRRLGYEACQNASFEPKIYGQIGAGTSATAGKFMGIAKSTPTGIGIALETFQDLSCLAVFVPNPYGNVHDPESGEIIAGCRLSDGSFADFLDTNRNPFKFPLNTVIGAVITDCRLSKVEATIVARMAHNGIARTIYPAHTLFDGDTIFALSSGNKRGDISIIGHLAAKAVAKAIFLAAKGDKSSS